MREGKGGGRGEGGRQRSTATTARRPFPHTPTLTHLCPPLKRRTNNKTKNTKKQRGAQVEVRHAARLVTRLRAPKVTVPAVYPRLCSPKVLCMEWVDGAKARARAVSSLCWLLGGDEEGCGRRP